MLHVKYGKREKREKMVLCTAFDTSLNHRDTNTAETKHSTDAILFDVCGVQGGTISGGNTTTKQTALVQRRLFVDFRNRDFSADGVL